MEFLPYRDAMMGRPWTVNGQINPISSMTVTGIPLAGPYKSSMMDYRESDGHRDYLKQQDAAFNSPTGLNSRREMSFGEPTKTPVVQNSAIPDISMFKPIKPDLLTIEGIRQDTIRSQQEMFERFQRDYFQATKGSNFLDHLPLVTEPTVKKPKSSWGPTIDHGNGLWEKRNQERNETLIGYTPYESHTHIGPDFVSVRDHKTGKGIHWNLK